MTNTSPTPETIRQARSAAGLTQQEAAALIHSTERAWRNWETGFRPIPASLWELFQIKTGQREAEA